MAPQQITPPWAGRAHRVGPGGFADRLEDHVDLAGQLESALNEFRGGVVVVSHDQRFLDAIEIDGTLLLDGGQLTEVADPQTSAGVAH